MLELPRTGRLSDRFKSLTAHGAPNGGTRTLAVSALAGGAIEFDGTSLQIPVKPVIDSSAKPAKVVTRLPVLTAGESRALGLAVQDQAAISKRLLCLGKWWG